MPDTPPSTATAQLKRTALPPGEFAKLAAIVGAHRMATIAELTRLFNADVGGTRDPKTIRKAIALSGLPAPPSGAGKGRPATLTLDLQNKAIALANARPDASVAELLVAFRETSPVSVCAATLDKALRKAGIVRPKGRHHPIRSGTPTSSPTRYNPRHRMAPPPSARRGYPGDLTDDQWQMLEPFLRPRRQQKPCGAGTRRVVDALLYMARTGCQWRFIPNDFPPWTRVAKQFYRWEKRGIWQKVNDALRPEVRLASGRAPEPSAVIVDSQSVKTTEKGGPVDMTLRKKYQEESDISSLTGSDS